MSVFDWMLVCHFVGDFLLQTKWQAENKVKGGFFNFALISHCAVYTVIFLAPIWLLNISPYFLILIFVSHLIFDQRSITYWWIRSIKRTSEPYPGWLELTVDQSLHAVILAIITLYAGR